MLVVSADEADLGMMAALQTESKVERVTENFMATSGARLD